MISLNKTISERYKKALVTVAMGFRTEQNIKDNGLYRFTCEDEKDLINYVSMLFKKNKSVLALKIKKIGYRSEHINIDSDEKFNNFIKNLNDILNDDNEIWIVSSSVIDCWRCRIYISNNNSNNNDMIEMAYSHDDHILDDIGSDLKVPYIYYQKEKNDFKILNTNLNENKIKETNFIIKDILSKYSNELKKVKEDLDFIGITGISLDVRVNNGYDFHDFDVAYGDIEKVIKYYIS